VFAANVGVNIAIAPTMLGQSSCVVGNSYLIAYVRVLVTQEKSRNSPDCSASYFTCKTCGGSCARAVYPYEKERHRK